MIIHSLQLTFSLYLSWQDVAYFSSTRCRNRTRTFADQTERKCIQR